MIDDDVFREEVEVSLRQAGDGELARIMQFIDRLPSRARLDDIVAPVRGRLALARPSRSVTPVRVLTAPIEDLLVDPICESISPWVAPRDILSVFHRLALAGVDTGELTVLEEEAQGAVMDDGAAVTAMGRRLWPAAAAALRRFNADADAEPTPGWRAAHRDRLAVIAAVLDHAETVTAFLDRLPPRPAVTVDATQRAAACAFLTWAAETSEVMGNCAFTMLLRRFADPAAAFALPGACGCGPIALRCVALAEAAVIQCLREVELIAAAVAGGDSPFTLADTLLRQAALLRSLETLQPPANVDGAEFSARLAAARTAAQAAATARFADLRAGPAAQRIIAVAAAGAGASEDEAAAAEAAARATAKIAAAGILLGCGDGIAAVARPLAEELRARLTAATAGQADEAARLTAAMDGLRLLEILFGPDAAEAAAAEIAPTLLRASD